MMAILFYGICFLFILYIIMTLVLIWGWKKMPVFTHSGTHAENTLYTIIIPVRNEAENILNLLNDLEAQTYKSFEVLIVNDHSEDNTEELVNQFIPSFSLQFIQADRQGLSSPKKSAIQQGLNLAKGSVIITTDGDCRMGNEWLATIHAFYQTHQPVLISAAVTFHDEQNWFEKVQTVEFMSLIGAGAIAMHLNKPNMCNGANLIYDKAAFFAVGGFSGSEQLASGDDEFLMHKIHQAYPNRVLFLKSPKALVKTKAQASLKSFIHQRKRWASKWNHYDNWSAIALAVFIYAFHAASIACLILMIGVPSYRWPIALLLCSKFLVEYFYLKGILTFFGKGKLLSWIPLTQLLYSIYILFIGALGQMGGYLWKGRRLK